MAAPNGHARDESSTAPSSTIAGSPPQVATTNNLFDKETLERLFLELKVPFEPSLVQWRVLHIPKSSPRRGLIGAYADPRAYLDRLNELFSPAGWTRKYVVHTSGPLLRAKDQKTVAKVFVNSEVTIFGINSHSAIGEEWADVDHAGAIAEAHGFKRACACFGLGRYLYYFTSVWADLDTQMRPIRVPALPEWATPEGWRKGLRPGRSMSATPAHDPASRGHVASRGQMMRRIDELKQPIGRAMYRQILRTVARKFRPTDIKEAAVLQRVLLHMEGAARGFKRLQAALASTGPEALGAILQRLHISSVQQIDNLKVLHTVVSALEARAGTTTAKPR